MKRIAVLLFALSVPGCFQPQALPDDFGAISRALATSITDQAVWDEIVGEVEGHVTHPGIKLSGGVEYFTVARLVGVDGEVELAGDGVGSQAQRDEAQAVIRALLSDTSTLDPALRDALQALLRPE